MSTLNRIECVTDGGFEYARILVDGVRLTPDRSLKVRNHSPTGFAWGYAGSGPAQLALAILLACDIPEEDASRLHQDFKFEFIAGLPQNDEWTLELDVREWAEQQMYRRGEL